MMIHRNQWLNFGVPQGSIMGPLIFNLYVADLQSYVTGVTCHQYADDTTLYTHCKPADLQSTVAELSVNVGKLEAWSREANLVINPSKTKLMLLSTPQLSKVHSLDTAKFDITISNTPLDRVTTTKLLGSHIHEHLNWEGNVRQVAASCYATLTTLRKLKNILPFHIKKNLAQALVLSKLYYNDIVYHSLPDYLMKRLQRVQKATASFVLGRFASSDDILTKLKWLPVKEQRKWNLLKATHKALHNPYWPNEGVWDTLGETLSAVLEHKHATGLEELTILVCNVKQKQPNFPKPRREGKTKEKIIKEEQIRYAESEEDEDKYALAVNSAAPPENINVSVGGIVVSLSTHSGASTNPGH
ncbi:hypothetical protein ACROYT_G011160 [Oculina patagonica]